MCRLIAYSGAPVVMDKLLYQPKNSLIHQNYNAQEIEEPLNGDGFGVGWYSPEMDPNPAVFVSVFPAWNNRNLRSIAPRIKSGCFFAHVRAASVGDISEANCHPFSWKQFMFMHNGGIGGFEAIRRPLRQLLSDEMYSFIKGQTDSEHFFALLLENLRNRDGAYTLQDMMDAYDSAIGIVGELKRQAGIKEETYINSVLTDGKLMLGTRFKTDTKDAALTLYYSRGTRYECEEGVCRMIQTKDEERSVLIVSEKLTGERKDWQKIPENHFVLVDAKLNVSTRPIAPKRVTVGAGPAAAKATASTPKRRSFTAG